MDKTWVSCGTYGKAIEKPKTRLPNRFTTLTHPLYSHSGLIGHWKIADACGAITIRF